MTERNPLMVGNWKMNANHLEAIQMVQKLSYRLESEDYDRTRSWWRHPSPRCGRCRS
jgi:triosephosphate isomerase